MNERERLIELLQNVPSQYVGSRGVGTIADYLLANGVIVLPCKVGDTVYVKWSSKIYPAKVYALRWDTRKNNFRVCVEGRFEINSYSGSYTHRCRAAFAWDNVGKTVFLTKEEAEKALENKQ